MPSHFSSLTLMEQFQCLAQLFHDILQHYGQTTGIRHARKHIAAALDVAMETAGLPSQSIAGSRKTVLTSHHADEVEETLNEIQQYLSLRRAA